MNLPGFGRVQFERPESRPFPPDFKRDAAFGLLVSRSAAIANESQLKVYLTRNSKKAMNAMMDQITEFDRRSFSPDQKGLRDFGSSMTDNSQGLHQRPTGNKYSWSGRDFDRPSAVSSPLNEW
jgi:hypothetical protein